MNTLLDFPTNISVINGAILLIALWYAWFRYAKHARRRLIQDRAQLIYTRCLRSIQDFSGSRNIFQMKWKHAIRSLDNRAYMEELTACIDQEFALAKKRFDDTAPRVSSPMDADLTETEYSELALLYEPIYIALRTATDKMLICDACIEAAHNQQILREVGPELLRINPYAYQS